mmetsp:Transcript_12931/g.25307  ORF Transcript_12931/g.25307 Transcript_12931/m.25307 type:complete len:196 (+) Transcript_12931:115-702(+)
MGKESQAKKDAERIGRNVARGESGDTVRRVRSWEGKPPRIQQRVGSEIADMLSMTRTESIEDKTIDFHSVKTIESSDERFEMLSKHADIRDEDAESLIVAVTKRIQETVEEEVRSSRHGFSSKNADGVQNALRKLEITVRRNADGLESLRREMRLLSRATLCLLVIVVMAVVVLGFTLSSVPQTEADQCGVQYDV